MPLLLLEGGADLGRASGFGRGLRRLTVVFLLGCNSHDEDGFVNGGVVCVAFSAVDDDGDGGGGGGSGDGVDMGTPSSSII